MASPVWFLLLACIVLLLPCRLLAQPGQIVTVFGSGTTNPARLINATIGTLSKSISSGQVLNISYQGIGSGAGKDAFIAGANDFALTEITMTSTDISAMNGTAFYTVPFVIEAISFFHNIPAAQISGPLNLTSDLIARILSRNITSWSNADIAFLNPGLTVTNATNIVVVHRQDRSSSTYTMSGYLVKTTKTGNWRYGQGATLTWPNDTVAVNGSGGMSSTVQSTPFSIGYMERGYGQSVGLSEIAILNQAGNYLTTVQADLMAAVNNVTFPDPGDALGWSSFDLLDRPGTLTWPITTFGYVLLRRDNTRLGYAGGLLVSFWQFTLGQQGQNATYLNRFGLDPVPVSVANSGLSTLSKLQLASGADPTLFTYSVNGTTSNKPLAPVPSSAPSPASSPVSQPTPSPTSSGHYLRATFSVLGAALLLRLC